MPTNLYKISGCKSGLLAFPSNRQKSWGTEGQMKYQPWISAGAPNQRKHPCLYGRLCLISARGGNTALKEAFKLLAPCPFLCAVTGNTPAPQAKCRLCPQWGSAIAWLAHSQSCVSRGTEDMGGYELFLQNVSIQGLCSDSCHRFCCFFRYKGAISTNHQLLTSRRQRQ